MEGHKAGSEDGVTLIRESTLTALKNSINLLLFSLKWCILMNVEQRFFERYDYNYTILTDCFFPGGS